MQADRLATLVALAQPQGGQPTLLLQLLPFAMILGIFYFIILLPDATAAAEGQGLSGESEGR